MYGAVNEDSSDVAETTGIGMSTGAKGSHDDSIRGSASGPTRGVNVVRVCFFICGVELCERLSFYTFNGTQAFFLERLSYPLAQASNINASMGSLCFLLTIFTGWLADVPLGRFRTILASSALYICASAVIAAASHPAIHSGGLYLFGTMGMVPLATAGIKLCLSLFGADQFDATLPEGALARERFFSWFFAAVNAGAFVAFALLVNFGNNGGPGVPQRYGYFAAYLIAGVFMMAALVLFLLGRNTYVITRPPGVSSTGKFLSVLSKAAGGGAWQAGILLAGLLSIVTAIVLSVASNTGNGAAISAVGAACAVFGLASVVIFCSNPSWLDAAGPLSGSEASIRQLLKLMPVIVTGQLGGLMAQTVMQVWYQNQACQMDLRMGSFQFSGAFFNIADCIIIVVGTPVAINVINPALEWVSGRKMSYAIKLYIGVACGVLAMLTAVFLEYARRAAPSTSVVSTCAPAGVTMKAVSAGWIVVPYVLTGISEVYVMPTIMYISYEKSPESLRTFATIVCMFVLSILSCILSLVNQLLAHYITDDLDKGHLEYIYYVCIAISVLFTLLFSRSHASLQESEKLESDKSTA